MNAVVAAAVGQRPYVVARAATRTTSQPRSAPPRRPSAKRAFTWPRRKACLSTTRAAAGIQAEEKLAHEEELEERRAEAKRKEEEEARRRREEEEMAHAPPPEARAMEAEAAILKELTAMEGGKASDGEVVAKLKTDAGATVQVKVSDLETMADMVADLAKDGPLAKQLEELRELKEDREEYIEVRGDHCRGVAARARLG